ncbi:glycosyltransferase [Dorea sp. ICN-14282]|uniref:glycosyltransferase n=1 Tax=Dorea sp. ICN-14282 TaxID=3134654 RepID=UPI0030BB45A7
MKRIFMVGYSTDKGGVEAYIMNLCSQLPKEEYEVIYDWPTMEIEGKTWIRPRNRHNYIAYKKFWNKFFRENHFDVMYYNTCDIVSIDMLKFAKKAKIPVRIIHSHNTGNQEGINKKMNSVHKLMEKSNRKNIHKFATHLLACSKSAGDWMFDKYSYQVIHNGIDLPKYKFDVKKRNDVLSRYGISGGKLVGCVGRLDPQKNPVFAEKIAEEVIKLDPDTMFAFVGDGELADQVKSVVKENNLEDKIIFAGAVDNVSEWMSALDCLVMPSLFEGLPFVLVEAQAAGLPCVVSSTVSKEADFTGLLQFIDLDSSEKVWAETILKACGNERKDYLEKLVAAGYSIKNTAKEVCEIIESVE